MRAEAKPFIPSSAATPASAIETEANVPNDPSSCSELRKISHHINSKRQCQNSQKCQWQKRLVPLGNDIILLDSNDHVTFPKLTNQKNRTNEICANFEDGNNRKSQNQQTAAFVQSQINTEASANAGECNTIRNLAPHRQAELGRPCNQSKRRVNKSRKKQNEFFIPAKTSFSTANETDNPMVTRRNNSRSTPQNDDFSMQDTYNKSSPDERGRSFEKTNAANVWDEHFSHKQKQRRRRFRKQSKYQQGGESANEGDRNSISVDGNPDESQISRKQSLSKPQQKQHQQRHQRKNNRREMPCTTRHGKHLGGSACANSGREPWGERTNATLSNKKNIKHEKFSKSKAIADNQTDGTFISDEGSFPTLTSNITDAFSVSDVEKPPKRNLIHAGESCWASKVASSVQLEVQQRQVLEEEKRLREQEQMSGNIHLISLSSHSTRFKHGKERNNVDIDLTGASIHDQYEHEDAVPREHGIDENSINNDTSRASIEETALALQSPSARHGGDSSTNSMPPILPNAKLKWSDKEISKMRRRLWMALREKRTKEERVCLEKASQKEKLVNEVDIRVDFDSSDDSSTSSLLSSSSSSSLSSSEDQSENDTKQPPSLKNRPFDEVDLVPRIISQPQQHSALQSRSVLDLERTCRHSQHPIHYIICHMAMIKIGGINDIDEKCCKYVSSTNLVLEHHGKSDEEIVLDSLLASQEMEKLSEWRTSRVDPMSLYFEWRNKNSCLPLHGFKEPKVFTNLLSADTTSMTPLQLAVYWNLPKAIRALLSATTQETLASHNGNRPSSKSNKAFEEDEYGRTSLMLACELRHLACIEALLSAMKVKTEHRDRKHGNTAFHYCCAKSLSEMDLIQDEEPIPQSSSAAEAIEILLNRTPQNLRKRVFLLTNRCGETILHLTCTSGDLVLLECLIKHLFERGQTFARKAFTVKNQLGHVPFLSAVASNALEVVSHFLVNLFNVGLNFNTWCDGCPLTVAASKCSVEMVRLLLEAFDLFQSHTICSGDPVVFDLNNALIETIRKKSNGNGSEDNDLFDIITLLVDNGANPHVPVPSRNHITEKDLILFDDTPLCTAVTFGDLAVVEYVIDGYSSWLKTRQANRRSDPILRSQPESFFKLVDQNEWDQVHSSLQVATAKSLFLHWRDQSTISYGLCSLYLYKRVDFLTQSCLQWLMQSIEKGILTGMPNFSGTDSFASYHFEASFVQYGLTENTYRCSKRTSYRGDRTDFKQFSEVMLKLNWCSSRRLQCKWLLNFATNHNNNYCDAILQSDEFYVVAEGKKLLAHKSICSAKSFKLAGALRFYEANEQAAEFCDGRLLIRIELPLLKCKMLLSHIYHGSIAFGLLGSPMKQCDQILEMALIAEEYLCPTLMLECEMRLLIGSASNATTASFNESSPCCICAHCSESYLFSKDLRPCPIGRVCLEDAKRKCTQNNIDCSVCSPVGVYSVIASNVMSYQTKLITSESAMNILAVADQLSQSSSCQVGYYVIRYCRSGSTELKSAMAKPTFGCWGVDLDNELGSGYLYKPFEAAKMTAIMVMLRDFHSVFKSESFFMQVQDDNSSSLDPSLCMASTNDREEDASLLLRTCLDEIAGCQLIGSFAEAKTVKR